MTATNHLVRYTDETGRINFVSEADLESNPTDALINLRDTFGDPLINPADNRIIQRSVADIRRGQLTPTTLPCPSGKIPVSMLTKNPPL